MLVQANIFCLGTSMELSQGFNECVVWLRLSRSPPSGKTFSTSPEAQGVPRPGIPRHLLRTTETITLNEGTLYYADIPMLSCQLEIPARFPPQTSFSC